MHQVTIAPTGTSVETLTYYINNMPATGWLGVAVLACIVVFAFSTTRGMSKKGIR